MSQCTPSATIIKNFLKNKEQKKKEDVKEQEGRNKLPFSSHFLIPWAIIPLQGLQQTDCPGSFQSCNPVCVCVCVCVCVWWGVLERER
jgi:hypothetical protein